MAPAREEPPSASLRRASVMVKDSTWHSSWQMLERKQSGETDPRARATAVLNLARSANSNSPPSNSADIVPEVLAAVKDKSVAIRRAALRLLEWFAWRPAVEAFGDHAQRVSAAAAEALSDEDVPVRCWAARVLTCIGPGPDGSTWTMDQLERVHAAVRDNDAAVRCLACGVLARMGGNAAGLAASYAPSVAWSLRDDDVEVRRAAAFALTQMDAVAIIYAAEISRALKRKPKEEGGDLVEPDVEVRRLCVNALSKMGDKASAFTPELLCALESDPDAVVRRWAIRTLEHCARTRYLLRGEDKENDIPSPMKEIALRISDPDPVVRQWVLLTLARLGKDAPTIEVMHAITQSLGDQEPLPVRCVAVGTAAQFRESVNFAKYNSPCISTAMNSQDKELRQTGALALALLGPALPKEATSQVLSALRDRDVTVRRGAARALENLRVQYFSEADIAEARGYAIDRDEDVAVRHCAIRTLGRLEQRADRYAGDVLEIIEDDEDPHPAVIMEAKRALPLMGTMGARLMYDYKRALEAQKIKEEEQNNPVGRCYRGIGDYISNVCYTLNQKVNRCLPESWQQSHSPTSGGSNNPFAGSTMRRFRGPPVTRELSTGSQ